MTSGFDSQMINAVQIVDEWQICRKQHEELLRDACTDSSNSLRQPIRSLHPQRPHRLHVQLGCHLLPPLRALLRPALWTSLVYFHGQLYHDRGRYHPVCQPEPCNVSCGSVDPGVRNSSLYRFWIGVAGRIGLSQGTTIPHIALQHILLYRCHRSGGNHIWHDVPRAIELVVEDAFAVASSSFAFAGWADLVRATCTFRKQHILTFCPV
jgi:hypothetical protein